MYSVLSMITVALLLSAGFMTTSCSSGVMLGLVGLVLGFQESIRTYVCPVEVVFPVLWAFGHYVVPMSMAGGKGLLESRLRLGDRMLEC